MSEELVKVEAQPLALRHELTIEELVAQVKKVHAAMDQAMVAGHHYGTIPGTDKPTLLKPGAELLCMMTRLDPEYATAERVMGDHLEVVSTCTLYHIRTGERWGSGQGSCSTRESKYAYRQAQRVCPECGKAAIIKGKAEYGGGWLCFKKRDGCGAKFKAGDAVIEAQETGRVANPDLPDSWNTVRKMANKRSLVAAVLNVTAASDIFTQDLEDAAPPEEPIRVEARSEPPAETPAEELFKTPLEEEAEQKAVLLGRIGAGMDMLKLSAGARADLWRTHCGEAAALMTDEATLAALTALLDALRAQHKGKK